MPDPILIRNLARIILTRSVNIIDALALASTKSDHPHARGEYSKAHIASQLLGGKN